MVVCACLQELALALPASNTGWHDAVSNGIALLLPLLPLLLLLPPPPPLPLLLLLSSVSRFTVWTLTGWP
jgi:hypothetical protein